MIVPVEKPGSPEEVLAHFGKKGMKWGQRREVSRAANAKFNKANPTSKQRTKAIQRARGNQMKRAINYHQTAKNSQARVNAKKAFLNNPDRATSLRFTRGEKVVFSILAPVTAPSGFGVGIAAGSGARVATRHRAERRGVKVRK